MANINILNYCASARNNVLATFSMPLDQGELSSTSTELSILSARSTPQRVQWYPFGARHPDGSYKYIRGACMTDMAAWESKSCQVVIGGGYVPTTYTPRFNRALGGIAIQFGLANEWIRLDLESATLLEGGGATDHYARYRLFTRLPVSRQYWIEFVYEIANDSPVVHYWLYFGNSIIRPNLGENGVGANAVVNPPGDSSGIVELVAIGQGAYLTVYDTVRSRVPFGGVYDHNISVNGGMVTNNWVITDPRAGIPVRSSCYPYGTSRCIRGSIFIGDGSDPTISAENEVQLSTLANNWNGRVPPAFAEVPVFSALSAAATSNGRSVEAQVGVQVQTILDVGLSYIAGNLSTQGRSWSQSPFGMQAYARGTGATGWRNSVNNVSPLQHMLMFGHPHLMPLLAHAANTLAYRVGVFREEDGTFLSRSRFPTACFWDSWPYPAQYVFSLARENLGYGNPTTQFWEPHMAGDWGPPDTQHDEYLQEVLFGLLSGDWFGLQLANALAKKFPLQFRSDDTGSGLDYFGAARTARVFKVMIAVYEITGETDVVTISILGKLYRAYQQWLALCPEPFGSLDKVKILDVMADVKASNLNNYHFGSMPWQDSIAVNHLWPVVRFLERTGFDPALTSIARTIAGMYAGSTLLYHLPKISEESTLRFLCIYGRLPNDGTVATGDVFVADTIPGWQGTFVWDQQGGDSTGFALFKDVPPGATWLPRWTLIRNTRTNVQLNVSYQAGPWTVVSVSDQGNTVNPATNPATRSTWRGVAYGTPLSTADLATPITDAEITNGVNRSATNWGPKYCDLGQDYVAWIGGVIAVSYKLALENFYGSYNSQILAKAAEMKDYFISQLGATMGTTWPDFLPYYLIDNGLMAGDAVISLPSPIAAPGSVQPPVVSGVSVVDTIINLSSPARTSGTVNLPLVVITNPGINATATPNLLTSRGRVPTHTAAGYTQVVNITTTPSILTSTTDVPSVSVTTYDAVRGVVSHANIRIVFSCTIDTSEGAADGIIQVLPNEPVSDATAVDNSTPI